MANVFGSSFFISRSISCYSKDISEEVDSVQNTLLHVHQELLRATACRSISSDFKFFNSDSIPDLEQFFSRFMASYPEYGHTKQIDQIRSEEYSHLSGESSMVCLDYSGLGLFSYLQSSQQPSSAAFALSEISGCLSNLAFDRDCGTETAEHDLKAQIFDYLNVSDDEYGIVFTSSRGEAFKLLAESYPFDKNKNLVTMFDYESQSANWMAIIAREKGAKIRNACFKWPSLKLCSKNLMKTISNRRRRGRPEMGLFVFPVQSRVTGTKYSYQLMTHAQKNGWHVLFDAESLGPKAMDSLELSVMQPDFIIASFYRVFGHDPSGFGCLFVSKSARGILTNRIVRISAIAVNTAFADTTAAKEEDGRASVKSSKLPDFSGKFNEEVKYVFEEYTEELLRSPVRNDGFAYDDYFFTIELGRSPSLSEASRPPRTKSLSDFFRRSTEQSMQLPAAYGTMFDSPIQNDYLASFDAALFYASQEIKP